MNKQISVAIDGPAAAGKSTVAKIIAEKLSYIYVDTGAMYRALTHKAQNLGIDLQNEEKLLQLLQETDLQLKTSQKGQLVIVDGQDVTEAIRSSEVTNAVSITAKHRKVREDMVARQRRIAEGRGVVMDGRDIGTHVLPNAEVKVFLRASVDERAKRRYEENTAKGFESNLEILKQEIAARDKLDSEREVAPLKKADDAVEIDTTSLNIEQVVDKIISLVNERI
ncbi:(d)CMP kinase [Priestia abyssalis]|uniref:(d)CMP kinase n=1 Tax=Priestia abyssalis TaxID=1221450 RepID=UPI000995B294|nr:(d)CMP kinase [Priestia abyssalis]